jgi:hypothetical protein
MLSGNSINPLQPVLLIKRKNLQIRKYIFSKDGKFLLFLFLLIIVTITVIEIIPPVRKNLMIVATYYVVLSLSSSSEEDVNVIYLFYEKKLSVQKNCDENEFQKS